MTTSTKRWLIFGLDITGLLLFWVIFGARYLPWAAFVVVIALVPDLFKHR